MFKNILVPIDITHSESSKMTLDAAAKLADASGASLTLLHVIADVPNLVVAQLPSDFAEKASADAIKQLEGVASGAGLKAGSFKTAVAHGSAYQEILEMARGIGADLVVIASHKPELSDYLLGSVAAKVVRHAKCSVLVVRK